MVPEPSSGPLPKGTVHWPRRNPAENMNTKYLFSLTLSFLGDFSLASVRLWSSFLKGLGLKRPKMCRCKADITACREKALNWRGLCWLDTFFFLQKCPHITHFLLLRVPWTALPTDALCSPTGQSVAEVLVGSGPIAVFRAIWTCQPNRLWQNDQTEKPAA